MTTPFPHDEHYDASAESRTRVWDGFSDAIQRNFHRLGATGVRVTVWSLRETPQVKHVILDSPIFQQVDLSLEQVNLILAHLLPGASTETAFVMAQAVEAGVDIDLVYDAATGVLKTPHAARKEAVA